MANGRTPRGRTRSDTSRDQGGFVAMPWAVLDSPAFALLGHTARSLLWEIARQYVRDNNGRLLCSARYLSTRGWKSSDVITRAKRELVAAGFIHETVAGHRPNKASWYAVTWYSLDPDRRYDAGAAELFRRGAYRLSDPSKNAGLTPSRGVEGCATAPSSGQGHTRTTPPRGAMEAHGRGRSAPPPGHHLDEPSAARIHQACSVVATNANNLMCRAARLAHLH